MPLDSSFTTDDAIIASLIVGLSSRVEALLRRYTEDVGSDRTEVIQVEQHQKVVAVLGYPVAATTSVKYSSTREFTNITALTVYDHYNLDPKIGHYRMRINMPNNPGWVEFKYQGGMGTGTANFIANFPEISDAIDYDIVNRHQRRANPQADINFQGGGVTFSNELQLGREIRRVIEMYRNRD